MGMDRKDMHVKRNENNAESQWKNRLNELKTLSRSTQMLTNSPSEDEVKRLSLPNVRRNNREIRGVSKENPWSKPLTNVFSIKKRISVNRLHRSSSSSSLSSSSSSFSNQGERVFHLPEKDIFKRCQCNNIGRKHNRKHEDSKICRTEEKEDGKRKCSLCLYNSKIIEIEDSESIDEDEAAYFERDELTNCNEDEFERESSDISETFEMEKEIKNYKSDVLEENEFLLDTNKGFESSQKEEDQQLKCRFSSKSEEPSGKSKSYKISKKPEKLNTKKMYAILLKKIFKCCVCV